MRVSATPPQAGLKTIVNEMRAASVRWEERNILQFRLLVIGEEQSAGNEHDPNSCLAVGEFYIDAKCSQVAARYVVVAEKLSETDEKLFPVNVGRYCDYTAQAAAAIPSHVRSWKLIPKDKCSRFLRIFYERWYLNPERRRDLPATVLSDDPFSDAADFIEQEFLYPEIEQDNKAQAPLPRSQLMCVAEIALNCPECSRSDKLGERLRRRGARMTKIAGKWHVELADAEKFLPGWRKWREENQIE